MVPRLWPSSTIVCLGSGPSLTAEDLLTVKAASERFSARPVRALAINTTYQAAPWCHALLGVDPRWWGWHPDALALRCAKFGLGPHHEPGIRMVEWTGDEGIETKRTAVRTGGHGGYAAINLAVHLGARRIVLLGYDLAPSADGRHHHHADHPNGSHPHYEHRRAVYATCLPALRDLGITIFNASRETTITAIPRMALDEALV
jgi:hypothetical protein